LRIVQALGWYFPEKLGGTEVYVRGLCARLRNLDCDVFVAAPEAGAAAPRTYEFGRVEVFRYPIPAEPTKAEAQSRVAVRGSEHFHRWLADRRPDVFHCHTFVSGLGPHEIGAAKRAGAKIVVTTHSSALGWICQRGTLMRFGETPCDGLTLPRRCSACILQQRGLTKPFARAAARTPAWLSRRLHGSSGKLATMLGMPTLVEDNLTRHRSMLEAVDAFVVLTAQAARVVTLNGCPPGKLIVNRLGISHANVVQKPDPDVLPTRTPITVGYLGRFDEIKGIIDLARAFSSLPKTAPIRLEIRGPISTDEARPIVAAVRSTIGKDDRVVVGDVVAPDDVPELLRGWDVACFPARCLEGGPTAAIEAHAVGTPVIGTRIGGLAELVTDDVNGALVAPTDVKSLAELLKRISADPAGTIDRWRRALPPARTMDEVARDYLELYHRLLADGWKDSSSNDSPSVAVSSGRLNGL
jgi:glycosyltransferase involved in cell wall biosynthesis